MHEAARNSVYPLVKQVLPYLKLHDLRSDVHSYLHGRREVQSIIGLVVVYSSNMSR